MKHLTTWQLRMAEQTPVEQHILLKTNWKKAWKHETISSKFIYLALKDPLKSLTRQDKEKNCNKWEISELLNMPTHQFNVV